MPHTTYDYDNLGRLLTKTEPDPDGGGALGPIVTSYAYDKVGNLTSVTDALGNITTYVYDEHNNLIQITLPDPDGSGGGHPLTSPVWTFTYDDLGNKLTSVDPMSRATTYAYDFLNRLTQETSPDPDGGGAQLAPRTTYTYDLAGNLLTATDRLSHATTYDYDHLHRQTSVTNANSEVTSFTYDAASNRLTLTDPELNTTTWTYDPLNRVLTDTNELSDTRSFEYDNAGNLTEKTDRLGRVTQYEYDHLHRRTAELWKDGATTMRTFSYEYDALGRLEYASDPDAAYDYTFNSFGLVTQEVVSFETLSDDVTIANAYDAVGNRLTSAATLGATDDYLNTYTYDNIYRLARLKQEGQIGGAAVHDKRIDFAYDPVGQFDTISRYADLAGSELVVESTYTYDAAGRLTELSHDKSSQLAGYEYAYDAASRITSIDSFLDGLSEYDYDSAGQLTDAEHATATDESYEYDDNGNRDMSGHDVGPNNQLLSDGVYDYEYDAEGNRIRRTNISSGEVDEYHWDYRNRLTSVATCDGTSGYGYGSQGYLIENGVSYGCGLGAPSIGWDTAASSGTIEFEAVPTGTRIVHADQTYFTLELVSGEEGESGYLKITKTPVSYPYAGYLNIIVTGLTANIGSDLSGLSSQSIPFSTGPGSTYVYFSMVDDSTDEGHETFSISVNSTVLGFTTPSTSINGVVYDNDGTAETYAFSIPYTVGSTGISEASLSGAVVFAFAEPVPAPLQFHISASSVTAVFGDDFDDITGATVNVAQNDTSALWEFEVMDDLDPEYDESFSMHFISENDRSEFGSVEVDIYDGENTESTNPAPVAPVGVFYVYDTYNRLIERKYFENATQNSKDAYVYDGNQIVLRDSLDVYDDSLGMSRFLWEPAVDQLLAAEQTGGSVTWPLADHLGTLRDLATHNNSTHATSIANHREYDSFGNLTGESNSAVDLLFGFTGRMYDEATGLQNNLNRWYDPLTGTWPSVDPIGFAAGDPNLSRYVGNGPTGTVDPSGLAGQSIIAAQYEWSRSPELQAAYGSFAAYWAALQSGTSQQSPSYNGPTIGAGPPMSAADQAYARFLELYDRGSLEYMRRMQAAGIPVTPRTHQEFIEQENLRIMIMSGDPMAWYGLGFDLMAAMGSCSSGSYSPGVVVQDYGLFQRAQLPSWLVRTPQAGTAPVGRIYQYAAPIGPGIGRSNYFTSAEFAEAIFNRYQRYYDRADAIAQAQIAAGRWPNDPMIVGGRIDAIARRQMRAWLAREGIAEGPGRMIQVNRWLRDPAGCGGHRIPDVRIPGEELIFDGTIGWKFAYTPQIADFHNFSGGGE